MRARVYRPDIGRFLTQDRYEAASSDLNLQADPLTQNRYAFAGGNPVSRIEFDGHHEEYDEEFPESNGCGPARPRYADRIVKDGRFHRACDVHDKCYGTYGKSKGGCDRYFLKRMKKRCNMDHPEFGPMRSRCLASARQYHKAVAVLGGPAYRDAQRKNSAGAGDIEVPRSA